MAKETEIKLTVEPSSVPVIADWLNQRGHYEDCQSVKNTYFDTPDGVLKHRQVALRIREVAGHCIQTLKTRGQSDGGVLAREEWEWPRPSPDLDPDLLDVAGLRLSRQQYSALAPVFMTNFERRIWRVTDSDTVIECVIDQGKVTAGERERPLCEVELELRTGDAGSLHRWAGALADSVPLLVNTVSKAEQGYYLAGKPGGQPGPGASLDRADALGQWIDHLSQFWLTGQASQLLTAWGYLNQLGAQCASPELTSLWRELLACHYRYLTLPAEPSADPLFAGGVAGRLQLALVATHRRN